ncbi:TetR/AcrR family transcriptional regulator [Phytomonospora endophytica]|uniref:AcrR family transcriptional regulator n=1 Tax=Phytomonospora endophytica TaxID=714109 RepID=A0A841FQS5_9ACTN|nr:TetR/AcrR family transcriptional regulator [Phytomonospora endophytica]MBB6037183.1 AcrR family transcriptional regulator [Phytomonospora endophytica]
MTPADRRAPRQAEAERNDRALLQAAKEVLAVDGAHASVAAIAKRAKVGIGTLYRRYRTKDDLFLHLLSVTLDQYLEAAEAGLALDDPWEGLAHYVRAVIGFGPGSLAPIAGTLTLTAEINEKSEHGDRAVAALIERAHDAGVLRADATAMDVELLIEQLSKSPLLDQLAQQGRTELMPAAQNARDRLTAIALDGLRAGSSPPLPGEPPGYELFSARWERD